MLKLLIVLLILSGSCLGSQIVRPSDASNQVDAIAWCIYQEARGESWAGKMAIASVLHNRRYNRGLTYKQVVFQRAQFSGVGSLVPVGFATGLSCEARTHKDCYAIAGQMIFGGFKPTGPWDHYFAHDGGFRPSWADKLHHVKIIGGHTFGVMRRLYY